MYVVLFLVPLLHLIAQVGLLARLEEESVSRVPTNRDTGRKRGGWKNTVVVLN